LSTKFTLIVVGSPTGSPTGSKRHSRCSKRQPDLPTVPNDLSRGSGLGTGNSLRWCNLKGLAARYARPTACPKNLGDAWSFLSFLRRKDALQLAKASADRSHCNGLAFSIVD
jgi:hypothetical protein